VEKVTPTIEDLFVAAVEQELRQEPNRQEPLLQGSKAGAGRK
jgi:hypothetical protein